MPAPQGSANEWPVSPGPRTAPLAADMCSVLGLRYREHAHYKDLTVERGSQEIPAGTTHYNSR